MNVYLYLPRDIEYASSGVQLIQKIFKADVRLIRKIPLEEKIDNGVLWINSHGYKRTDKHDFMIEANGVKNDYKSLLKYDSDRAYIESKYLPKFFNVSNSIILFDSCYSSEVNISTLSDWKSNNILTTGYGPDVYNSQWSGLIKMLCVIYDDFIVTKKVKTLTPEILRKNKEDVDKLISATNSKYSTEFNLF